MKLDTISTPVEVHGGNGTSSFSIAMNGKAFKVLSSTLYQNKIGSIVREVSCNAYDAHIMAGKADVPFLIHLPDAFEPWFTVKDYGVGLSAHEVKTVFAVYFESTKDQSNDAIGAFGLGAKTPFSYTDQFSVTTIKDGQLNVYSAYITESGVPDIVLMHNEQTTEQNGVEIKMSVKREDYAKFKTEVQSQLRFFKVKPKIENGTVTYEQNISTPVMKTSNVCIYSSTGCRQEKLVAIQGNVGYPLNVEQLKGKITPDNMQLLNMLATCVTEIYFNIGEIGVTASREGIEYVKITTDNIDKKLTEINKELNVYLEQQLQSKTTAWDKALYLKSNPVVQKLAVNFKINGVSDRTYFDLSSVLGHKSVVYPFTTLHLATLSIRNRWENKTKKISGVVHVCESETIKFVLKDKSNRNMLKTKYLFSTNPKLHSIYFIETTNKIYDDALTKSIVNALGGFSDVIKLSDVILPVTAKSTVASVKSSLPTYYLYKGDTEVRNWGKEFDAVDEIEDDVVYIVVKNMKPNGEDDLAIDDFYTLGKFESDLPMLIAISEKTKTKIKDLTNFTELSDFISDKKQEYNQEDVKLRAKKYALVDDLAQVIPSYLIQKNSLLQRMAPENELSRLVLLYTKLQLKKNSNPKKVTEDRHITSFIGFSTYNKNAAIIERVGKMKDAYYNKYPLVRVLDDYRLKQLVSDEHIGLYLHTMHKALS